jgi:hypothetical protein
MPAWTDSSKDIGQRLAYDILVALLDMRQGAGVELTEGLSAENCRYLIENAARAEPVGTIAALGSIVESLLHRHADATERTEREVFNTLMSETNMVPSAPETGAHKRERR